MNAPSRSSIPAAAPIRAGRLVPATGNSGAGVVTPVTGGAVEVPEGVDVAQIQFVAFKQLGFRQTPLEEQTMEFAQSELLLQESPQESGGTGVAVAVGVGVELGLPDTVGVGEGLTLGETLGDTLGDAEGGGETAIVKVTSQALPWLQ